MIHVFEILSNLGHMFKLSSGYVQSMFSVYSEYVQGMFRTFFISFSTADGFPSSLEAFAVSSCARVRSRFFTFSLAAMKWSVLA